MNEKPKPEEPRKPDQNKPDDDVDEAGKESFPASDPPAWNAAIAHRCGKIVPKGA